MPQARGVWCGVRLEAVTAQEVEDRRQQHRQATITTLHERMGVSCVMELLRDARLPLVFHNGSLDLLFITHQFLQPLPATWREYQNVLRTWLPGGVYDTKLIANQGLPGYLWGNNSSLENIHVALTQPESDHGKGTCTYHIISYHIISYHIISYHIGSSSSSISNEYHVSSCII